MKRIFFLWLLLQSMSFVFAQNSTSSVRNIILMIGDGMGLSQISGGMYANRNRLQLERCKYIGLAKTHSANKLITDSAAGATAIACGQKTNNGILAMDTKGNELKTILEIAHENQLSTGIIATSMIQHATPAAFYSHKMSRIQYEEISLDLMEATIDVLIGGGRRLLEGRKDGRNLIEELKAQGVGVCKTLKLARKLDQDRIFVFAANGHLAPARKRPRNFLGKASRVAIDRLDENNKGFFLMVESSQIDWGGHANDASHILEEMIDFDRAIGQVFDFADQDGETLVIITADHETGGFAIEGGEMKPKKLISNFTTYRHTATMVPVFAYGPGASAFSGIYENTQIYYKMMEALGFVQPR